LQCIALIYYVFNPSMLILEQQCSRTQRI